MTSIGASAFSGCTGLSGITLSGSVTSIGDYVFQNCTGVKQVSLASTKIGILGGNTFKGCSNLELVELPSTLTSIPQNLFSGLTKLNRVVIPEGVESVGASAFSGCTSLTEIAIPNSVTSIGDYAFKNCTGLTGVVLSEGVLTIGKGAFSGCNNVASISIPKSLTTIAPDAFSGCEKWNKPVVTIVSSKIRESDPTIMDVVYRVDCPNVKTVKVRVLAFEDGDRSFLNIIRPETFVEGTSVNVGDGISIGEEHTLSWKVSADWQVKLAKVKVDILATVDGILPLKLMTIPASILNPDTLQISYNEMSNQNVIDAFFWLFADKDIELTVSDGVLKNGNVRLVYPVYDSSGKVKQWNVSMYESLNYIYNKMGFRLLQGAELDYANEATRLELPAVSKKQFAVRTLATGSTLSK